MSTYFRAQFGSLSPQIFITWIDHLLLLLPLCPYQWLATVSFRFCTLIHYSLSINGATLPTVFVLRMFQNLEYFQPHALRMSFFVAVCPCVTISLPIYSAFRPLIPLSVTLRLISKCPILSPGGSLSEAVIHQFRCRLRPRAKHRPCVSFDPLLCGRATSV